MKKQFENFDKAYDIVKKKGFENYFCLPGTTWKDAKEKIDSGLVLTDQLSQLVLTQNIEIVIATQEEKKLPICEKCKTLMNPQEFNAGFKICEYCERQEKANSIKEQRGQQTDEKN